MYPQVYQFIETYEGQINTLDCMIAELERGDLRGNDDVKQAIQYMNKAKLWLWNLEGKIDPSA